MSKIVCGDLDADFQPDENFLWRTIPYLLENNELGLVQAR